MQSTVVVAGNRHHVLQETNDLHHVEMQLASYAVNVEKGAKKGGFEDLFGGCAVGLLAVLTVYHLHSVRYRFAESIAMQPWHPP